MLGMLQKPEPAPAPERPPDRAAPPEQRRITVMFVTRSDSNEFAPALSPEELQEILSAERVAVRKVLERHGGRVVQRLGREQLVLFGFPVAREDAPIRAVTAALEIQEAILLLEREWQSRLAAPFAVRIGIHTGPAIVEVPEDETDAFAYGPTVDAAVALAQFASAGQVLASADLHRRVGSSEGWVPSGTVRVPGLAAPLRVYAVWSQEGAGAPGGPVAPFVGREREIAQLCERFRRACAGEGQLVVVRGESGIGKSRLLEEVRARIAGEPHRWFQAQCTPYTMNTPLYPYSQNLAQSAESDPISPRPSAASASRNAFEALEIERPDLLAPLERLLAVRGPDEPPLNPKAERDATHAAIFAVTKRAAEIQPIVFVVEDLHWADPSTLEMLELAHAVRAEVRALLICTMRPEFEFAVPPQDNALEIQLGPLDAGQTRRIAEFFAAGRVAETAIDAIVARADGNPLFAGELARHARETGPADEAIPASLHDSLMARLDRLGDERRIAQVASVLGRSFARNVLRRLDTRRGARARRGAPPARGGQLIAGVGLPPGAHYEFRHALIRDAAYESIPPRRRAALHAQAARAIEAAYPGWSARNPEMLAHHHERAAQHDLAAAAWERAADRALETAANVEATRHLERALAAAARIAGSRERDELELRLLLKLGRSLLATRGRNAPEVERTFARAHALCRAHAPTPSVFGGLSEIQVHSAIFATGARARWSRSSPKWRPRAETATSRRSRRARARSSRASWVDTRTRSPPRRARSRTSIRSGPRAGRARRASTRSRSSTPRLRAAPGCTASRIARAARRSARSRSRARSASPTTRASPTR